MSDLATADSRLVNHRLVPPPGEFAIDPFHTFVTFRAQHLVVGRVKGRFDAVAGTVSVTEEVLDSHVEVSIEAASISTQMPMRDDDLRSSSYLDVERYPYLTFRSSGITELPSGAWAIGGDLSIREVTRPTELIVEFGGAVHDPFGNLRLGFHATTSISRKEFGLLHDLEQAAGTLRIARDVLIEIDAEAVRPL
jgi:polyisoprenoid-binding protein YceI